MRLVGTKVLGFCAFGLLAFLSVQNAGAQGTALPTAAPATTERTASAAPPATTGTVAPAAATTGTTTDAAPAPKASAGGGKPYYIEFRARSAHNYGHTFAVIARVGERLTRRNVHGLHPATDSPVPWMIGHIIAVPSETGWSDGDIEDQYIIARYKIFLTAAEYKKLMAHVDKLKKSSPHWHAVLYNCNAFVGDIALSLGLRTPHSTLLMPREYINELKSLNTSARRQAAAPAPTRN